MTSSFQNRLRANALAVELCTNSKSVKDFVNLALILEDKITYQDLDEEATERIIARIQAKHKKMSDYIDRVHRMIDQRRLARAIAKQQSSELHQMVIIMVLMMWFDRPKNKPSPRC